jgi:hypothetical protein
MDTCVSTVLATSYIHFHDLGLPSSCGSTAHIRCHDTTLRSTGPAPPHTFKVNGLTFSVNLRLRFCASGTDKKKR